TGIGYSAPIIIHSGGMDQLIVWHESAVSSLNPNTGAVYWEQPFPCKLLIATPVIEGNLLLVSTFFNGSMMLELAQDKPAATLLWKGKSDSEKLTDGLHSINSTPAIKDGYVFG